MISTFGSENAGFTPIAAVVAAGMSAVQRLLRAFEIRVGVVLGLLRAVLLAQLIGTGGWQLAVADRRRAQRAGSFARAAVAALGEVAGRADRAHQEECVS